MFNTFRGLKRDSYSWDKYQPVKILNVVQFVFVLSFCREEQKNRQKYLCHKEIYNLKIRCNIRSCAINIRKHILSKQHQRYTRLHNIIYIHFLPCWQHFEHLRSSRKYISYITGQKKQQEHGGLMICPENGDHTDERHSPPSWISFSDKLVPIPTKKL